MTKKIFIIIVAILLLALTAIIITFKANLKQPSTSNTTQINTENNKAGISLPYTIAQGCRITRCFAYSGPYVEDGSDTPCENIFALLIENRSGRDIQLLSLKLKTRDRTYSFRLTTLLNNHAITVLEAEALEFSESDITEVYIDKIIYFSEKPSLCLDILRATPQDGFLNIKNISDKDIANAYFYYKNPYQDGSWLGGITYRAAINQAIKSNELRQIPAAHFRNESKILFVTYGE